MAAHGPVDEVALRRKVPDAVTPTTAARFGKWLYVVDAQFALGGGPDLSYEIFRIERWQRLSSSQ